MKKFLFYFLALLGIAGSSIGVNYIGFSNRTAVGAPALALTAVATSSLSAAQICGNSFISITPVSTTPTITLPASSTLLASCITPLGQTWDVNFQAITTSTILVAGAGGTIINSSASTIAANKGAILRFIHDTNSLSGTYLVYIINVLN